MESVEVRVRRARWVSGLFYVQVYRNGLEVRGERTRSTLLGAKWTARRLLWLEKNFPSREKQRTWVYR